MTPKISLIVGVAAAALVLGVPTALAEGRLAGSIEPQDSVVQVSRPDSHDIVVQPSVPQVSRPDSHDIVSSDAGSYIDAADRARRINTIVPTAYTDAHERSAPPQGTVSRSTEATGSGNELDWSQLGIAFGLGLLLATGLFVAMRMTRNRPLAH